MKKISDKLMNAGKEALKKVDEEFPIAAAYFEDNHHVSSPTPYDERKDGVDSSITTTIYPQSGEAPDNDTIHDVYHHCKRFTKLCGVEEARVQFVVNDEHGEQRIVRNLKVDNPNAPAFIVDLVADCGQKVSLGFDSKALYEKMRPMFEKTNYLNNTTPKYISDEPLCIKFNIDKEDEEKMFGSVK